MSKQLIPGNNSLTVDEKGQIGGAIFIKSNGNVGIGTTNPGTKLDVIAGASVIPFRLVNSDTGSYSGIHFGNNAGTLMGHIGYANTGTPAALADKFYFGSIADKDVVITTNDAVKVTIKNTGNLGIGTTAPSGLGFGGSYTLLNLHGGSNAAVFTISSNTITSGNSIGTFAFGSTGSSGEKRTAGIQAILTADGTTNAVGDLFFVTNNAGTYGEKVRITSTGNLGVGTTSPTNLLSLGGNSARIFWLERHTTANTAGNTLTITAGGATSGATDKSGGALILQGGLSTGTGESGVTIQGCVAGATGTADRTQTTAIQVLGNKIGVFAATAAVQQNTIVDADGTLADITTKFNTLLAALETYGWLKSV